MKADKDYTGFPGDCNAKQLEALAQFRVVVTGMGLTDPPFDDPTLLRFLRARKFDLPKTQQMFTDHITWYKENDVENINKYMFSELPQVRAYYPHGYHKTDKLGRPIYIERIGKLQLNQLFQITSEQRLIRYYIQSYETLLGRIFPACTKAKGSRVDQTLTILDLKDCSMKMASKQVYNFIQLASKIGQDHYPEILGKMFIVNAPMLFSGIWSMIKIWLDDKTKAKITIIGSSYKEEVLKFVDIDNLPDFLGGNSKSPEGQDLLAMNVGPWNPDGKSPLFPCEPGYQDPNAKVEQTQTQQLEQQQPAEDEGEDEAQLAALRQALGGLVVGPSEKAPHNPDKYEHTQTNNAIISDTPLNTEAGEDDHQHQGQQQQFALKD